MISAFVTSSSPDVVVIYHAQVGSSRIQHRLWRTIYFSILIRTSCSPPSCCRWQSSRCAADWCETIGCTNASRWTLPLWLFVSVTGVVVYLLLYV